MADDYDYTQAEDTGTPWWEVDMGSDPSFEYDIPDDMIPVELADGSIYYIQATESPTGEMVYSDYTESVGGVPITYNEDGTVDASASAANIIGNLGSGVWGALKKTFTKSDGSLDWAAIGTAAAGLYGTLGGGNKVQTGGYSKPVPQMTAVRQAVPYTPDPNRVPGSAGRRYFSDTTFVPQGGDVAAAQAAAQTQAKGLAALPQAQQPVQAPAPATPVTWNKPATQMAEGGKVPEFQGHLESGGFVMNGASVRGAGNGDREQGLQALHQSLGAQAIRGPGTETSDSIPTTIDGKQPAAVANGEAYVPRDKVAQIGGGNVERGADKLMKMMDRLREQAPRKQGIQGSDGVRRFPTGGEVPAATTGATGYGSSSMNTLSPWVGDYVTNALGQGAAMAAQPYQAYTGSLTAGASPLQQQAFAGISSLARAGYQPSTFGSTYNAPAAYNPMQFGNQYRDVAAYTPQTYTSGFSYNAPTSATQFTNQFKTPTAYTPTQFSNQYKDVAAYTPQTYTSGFSYAAPTSATQFTNQFKAPTDYAATTFGSQDMTTADVQRYMNPYLQTSLDPQLKEAQRQAQIQRLQDASRLTKAGAFGGARQAIMESEGNRNLLDIQGQIAGRGYDTAFKQAQEQFNADQARRLQAQQATEASRQFGATQGMNAAQLAAQYGLSAQQAQEAARQFNAGQKLSAAQLQAQFGLDAQKASDLSRQFAQTSAQNQAANRAQYGLAAQQATEASRQFGASQGMNAAQLSAQYGLSAQQAQEAARQFNAGQKLSAAQLQAQFGLDAQKASDLSRQFAQTSAQNQAANRAQYGLAGLQAQEASRQFGAAQGMTAAQLAAQYGLEAQQAQEASRQYAAKFGLESLNQLANLGQQQRGITAEGLAADKAQFEEERDWAYKMPQYQLGLLSGLPIGAATTQPNTTGLTSLGSDINNLLALYQSLSGATKPAASSTTTSAATSAVK